ncbi:putative mitochondrial 2-oxoglutarate/malate carrier protein [Fusarium oxysporum f. sp. albedinis]|nr:putative mitochondrial 2-oxoglutarate/malate carrier protein [Fusarium oxysporum f. sp. albedinis]
MGSSLVASDVQSEVANGILHTPLRRGILPFINRGISGMIATTVIQPIDMVKCRILDFYAGLFAGLFRQGIYTSSRLGFFDMFMKHLQHHHQVRNTTVNFAERCATGFLAGGLAAKRSNYRSVIDALVSITKAEGGRALWAGVIPTIARAMSLNLGPNKLFTMKDVKNPC